MLVGYARISTADQSLNLQKDNLEESGWEKIYHDVASGVADSRPGLEELMKYIREGDTLVVWKLDRLGRSLRNLIDTINNLNDKGIGFKSIRESIDTTTSGGKLVFHIFASLAEFERELITERTQAGLKAARARGRLGGRPSKLDDKGIETARNMMKDTTISITEICKILKISRATLYRSVKKL